MIELSHVTKTFGGAKRALDDLTLTVPQGAVYGLVGSNGAGKTTAIRHITGIFRPDSGSVTIGGLPVYENPPVKSRIGYIPDDLGVFGGGTLRELAAFFRTMYPRFDAKRYAALRDVFRLDESTPLRRFSKGMQKHAAFWLTLSMRPDYLVLDEPLPRRARQGEAFVGLRRIRTALQFLNARLIYRGHSNATTYKFGIP